MKKLAMLSKAVFAPIGFGKGHGAYTKSFPKGFLRLAFAISVGVSHGTAIRAQIVGYDPRYYHPLAPQAQQGPPCGHYGTPVCPEASAADLPEVDGTSGQELWLNGSKRLQMHDTRGAAAYFKRSAELGDPHGEASFGQALLLGRGVARNPSAGLAWVRKSADSGNEGGEFALGEVYASGEIVPRDPGRAAQLYAASAQQGFAPAERKLGIAYETGDGVSRSRATAIKLLLRASNNSGGDAWPRQVAGFLSRASTPRFSSEAQLYNAYNAFIASSRAAFYNAPHISGGVHGPGCTTGGGTFLPGGGCGSDGTIGQH